MALLNIIAHHIISNPSIPTPKTSLRNDESPTSGILDELIYDLKTYFIRKNNKFYGKFSHEIAEFPVSTWLREYREQRLGFVSFTHKIMEQFQLELEKTQSPIDAYVFFAIEKIEAGEFLYIFTVEHTGGVYIDNEINLATTHYLHTTALGLSAKINITDWEQGDSNTFLTIARERGDKELSDAFSRTMGFSDKHDIKNDTVEFLKSIDDFSQTLDENTAKLTRAKVVDYCLEQNKAGKSVVIKELSNSLAEDLKTYEPEHFTNYINTTQNHIKTEFIPDTSQIRNYARISGRSDALSMSFDAECLGKEIVYDASSDSLTIKHIPPALKARLLKHLKTPGDE